VLRTRLHFAKSHGKLQSHKFSAHRFTHPLVRERLPYTQRTKSRSSLVSFAERNSLELIMRIRNSFLSISVTHIENINSQDVNWRTRFLKLRILWSIPVIFLKVSATFLNMIFFQNFVLKLSTSSNWEYKYCIWERHNFLCVVSNQNIYI